jgi:hypothetical protein
MAQSLLEIGSPIDRIRAAMNAASRQSPSRLISLQPRPFGFGDDFAVVDRDGVGRVFKVIAGVRSMMSSAVK